MPLDALDLNAAGSAVPPPNCCRCGRFVSVETAHRHVEQGDYGTVYSVEFECPNGAGCNAVALRETQLGPERD